MIRMRSVLAIAATVTLLCAAATAGTVTHEIVLQPIQIQSDDGSIRAPMDLFEAETDAVYMQADIDIRFLAPVEVRNSSLLTRTDANLFDLFLGTGNGKHADPNVLNVWYLNGLMAGGVPSRGLAFQDGNGIAIDGNLNQPLILAHLIGHNLDLEPGSGGHSADPNNLMFVPPGPNLSPEQITRAQASRFSSALPPAPPPPTAAVPLPGAAFGGLLLLGLLAIVRLARRYSRAPMFGGSE
jgi:hypothetical protein